MDLEAEWPEGPHKAQLDAFDEHARCPICHEFFNVPLTLGCGHAFCSGCIRNNLEFQERKGPAKCPACREKCDARDLRPNHALKDLVQGYLQTRNLLVSAASGLEASTPDAAQAPGRAASRKRRQEEQPDRASKRAAGQTANGRGRGPVLSTDTSSPAVTRMLRPREGPGKGVRSSQGEKDSREPDSDIHVSLSSDTSWSSGPVGKSTKGPDGGADRKATASTASKPPPGYVVCPSCTAQVREALLNDHLDKCLEKAGEPKSQAPAKRAAPVTGPVSAPKAKKRGCKLEVPPKLVFSMLTSKELSSKLKAFRLPTEGKRQDLEQRYNKLRVEVQMAQDADEPVTMDEAVRRVMRREKQTAPVFAGARPSRHASKANPPIPGASSFEELIAKSRDKVASRRDEPQPSTQQQQGCDKQGLANGSGQHSGRPEASEPAQEGSARGAGLQNVASSDIPEGPHHRTALAEDTGASKAKDLPGGMPSQCCGAYSAQQAGVPPQSLSSGGGETTRCTVYAREPGEKHGSACCGAMPDRVGFLKPLGLQDSVPDSASD
ncbi:hypothetical protein CVIRNUC_006444 [Coccomyxa viridis]|uniref:RING-type E3 ubiquitin transferase n=1 Tax=Coccomyxa viridis TaxID=1274662 RepID=A0AAV1IB66_9CHLO|nr:hypothetical protein CVIRNUC_006444 [Coccomyxa viridis]